VETDLDIVRLDAPEFNIAWRSPGGTPIRLLNQSVLVRQRYPDLRIRCLTLDRGDQRWEHPVGNTEHVRVCRDQVVILGNPVTFLRQDTGALLRRLPLPVHSHLRSYHDFLLVQAATGLSAVDMTTGERLWPVTWPREVSDALSYDGETILDLAQNRHDCVLSVRARIEVSQIRFNRDARTPEMVWTAQFPVPQQWPTVHGDRLFALHQGHFRCLDLVTGQRLYDRGFPGIGGDTDSASSPAVVQGEMISFMSFRGLRSFRARDGELMAQYDGNVPGFPLLFGDRYVVFGAGGWLSEYA
jgi:hypothetical protein